MFASDFPDPAVLPGEQAHALQSTLASMGYTRGGLIISGSFGPCRIPPR
jgi:hypothetical protein